ncbi:hypothetical protein KPY62_10940 [Psychrobacter sp. TAE2020]|uniref:hypothetical protein n=1 Tax=Psychrobacter sp. TAE2020 TaxID=2846762 RepID=UPI001C122009|nr:hypothetical protein [Psychrobacter sp. TAE2020]MBU5617596.1 hypothetical protein [Psychrobacter sp. TAE2020]
MRTKTLKLPPLLMASLLSTGLLLSGCSSNDVDEVSTEGNSADTVANKQKADSATDSSSNSTEKSVAAPNSAPSDATTDQAVSDVTNPALATGEQPSLVNNPTQAGTPEDTVKQALNTLYYGDVKQAATYYKVDLANFEQELAKTQYAFQQTVEGVTITNTSYNDDKTRATIDGELMLKGQKQPAPLSYELQKVDGKWKILG